MKLNSLRSLAPVLVVGVVLGGCSSTQPPSTPSAPVSSAPPTPGGPLTSSTIAPVPTTPVPAPTPGSTQETVPPKTMETRKPVKVGATSEPAPGVTVHVVRLNAIQAKAQGPGEVAGPALVARVEIGNDTKSKLDLSAAVVSLTASDGSPGQIMSGSPTSPFPAAVASGRNATGTYVFTVPEGKRDPVRIDVTVSTDLSIVAFRGTAPR